jgi:phage-related protein
MKTVNIRVYETTHKRLRELAQKKRQQMIVALDDLIMRQDEMNNDAKGI